MKEKAAQVITLLLFVAIGIVFGQHMQTSARAQAQEAPGLQLRLVRAEEAQTEALEELARERRTANSILRNIERRCR